MIFLDVVGRCGNQMFQYAFAKKISVVNNNEEICVDFFHVYEEGKKRNDNTFVNELNSFKASESFIEISDGANKIYKYGSNSQVLVFKLYKKLKHFLEKFSNNKRLPDRIMYKVMSHFGIYWYYAPDKIKKCRQKNKFIWGYFEDPVYFSDIRDLLCSEFEPIEQLNVKNAELHNVIENTQSVCLSFRKWDVNEPVDNDWFVCDEEYYKNAIDMILERVPNAVLVVFSNDIQWVKDNFQIPCKCFFEEGDDEVYEKMRLMYSCKHFILSNSTFAWWAQYLGRNEDKIIISPNCWHKNEKNINPLLQSSFQKIGENYNVV